MASVAKNNAILTRFCHIGLLHLMPLTVTSIWYTFMPSIIILGVWDAFTVWKQVGYLIQYIYDITCVCFKYCLVNTLLKCNIFPWSAYRSLFTISADVDHFFVCTKLYIYNLIVCK